MSGELEHFRVGNEVRTYPLEWWDALRGAHPDPRDFGCDGCSFSPDRLFGIELWPACVVHDYHYRAKIYFRRFADTCFYYNLLLVCRQQGAPAWLARCLAWLYWGRVRIWGGAAYGGGCRTPLWRRLAEVWTRRRR